MIFWNGQISFGNWKSVELDQLSGEGNFFNQCADYCFKQKDCNSISVHRENYHTEGGMDYFLEYYFDDDIQLIGDGVGDAIHTIYTCQYNENEFSIGPRINDFAQMGVLKDYYKANRQNLPSNRPDGSVVANYDDPKTVCEETNTSFGNVNYRNMKGMAFKSAATKNIVIEPGSNCAARCFEKAGCSSFYMTDNGCTFIIGFSFGAKTTFGVSEAGKIHDVCPNSSVQNTYTRVSRLACLFFTSTETESIADNIVRANIDDSNTPLRTWNFKTKTDSPTIASSQYISVNDVIIGDFTTVIFTIETHVRIGNEGSKLRRQRSDEDILAEIETIERHATSFILDGDMELPQNIEVAATGPIEIVKFVQTAPDGSVAADCSSGICTCSAGFIDNGNGCEEMTEAQAATSMAPTTSLPTTTKSQTFVNTEYMNSLISKVESILKAYRPANRPANPRPHLVKKWKKMKSRNIQVYLRLQSKCQFTDSFEYEAIDFNVVNRCDVSFLFK